MKLFSLFFLVCLHSGFSQEGKIYTSNEVESHPSFEGFECVDMSGLNCFENQLNAHIKSTIQYPEEAMNKNLSGKVYLQFIIQKTGKITDIKARGTHGSFEREGLRIIQQITKLTPAKVNGSPVSLIFNHPINFSFDKEKVGETSIYFPREQLVHPKCEAAGDPTACLNQIIQEKVATVLYEERKNVKNGKDSLAIRISFGILDNGTLPDEPLDISISGIELRKKSRKTLAQKIRQMPSLKVLNRKSYFYRTRHVFNFTFRHGADGKLESIPHKKRYEGGTIEEIPIFPGCEGLSYTKATTCFNSKMQQHIRRHFQYPKEAIRKNISGKVEVTMNIGKSGEVESIRAKGPHSLLEQEAIRIIKLLPKFKPALGNGLPVTIPYSVPITFGLKSTRVSN